MQVLRDRNRERDTEGGQLELEREDLKDRLVDAERKLSYDGDRIRMLSCELQGKERTLNDLEAANSRLTQQVKDLEVENIRWRDCLNFEDEGFRERLLSREGLVNEIRADCREEMAKDIREKEVLISKLESMLEEEKRRIETMEGMSSGVIEPVSRQVDLVWGGDAQVNGLS